MLNTHRYFSGYFVLCNGCNHPGGLYPNYVSVKLVCRVCVFHASFYLFSPFSTIFPEEPTNIKLAVDCIKCGRKDYATPGSSYHDGTPHIIESTWKGYDIFYVEGMGNTVFCTEQFIKIYNQNKLSGLEFVTVQAV